MLLIFVVLSGFVASASEGMVSSFTNSEVVPVMAKKTSTAGRIAIAIAKLENKSEMPDSTLVELRSRLQQESLTAKVQKCPQPLRWSLRTIWFSGRCSHAALIIPH
jgi:uncharacterized OB-fold protein